MPTHQKLRAGLVKVAASFPKGSDERRKILRIIREADFDPDQIGETVPGAEGVPGSDADESWMNGEFTQQENVELLDKEEDGILADGKPDDDPANIPAERPVTPKTASAKRASLDGAERDLFKGLVRLAHSNKEARKPVLAMLCSQGLIDCDKQGAKDDEDEDEKSDKTAGCEKLPEGPMRDNCEKKKEEGAKADKKAGCEKLPEGPMRDNCEKKKSEGDKKAKEKYPWDQCIKDQMKQYGNMETAKKVCGKIKAESQGKAAADDEKKTIKDVSDKDAALRVDLIKTAAKFPKGSDERKKILALLKG